MQICCAEGNDHGVCVSHGGDKRGIVYPDCNACLYCGNTNKTKLWDHLLMRMIRLKKQKNFNFYDYELIEQKAAQKSWFWSPVWGAVVDTRCTLPRPVMWILLCSAPKCSLSPVGLEWLGQTSECFDVSQWLAGFEIKAKQLCPYFLWVMCTLSGMHLQNSGTVCTEVQHVHQKPTYLSLKKGFSCCLYLILCSNCSLPFSLSWGKSHCLFLSG